MQLGEEDGKMTAGAGQLRSLLKSSGCQIFYFPVENGIISLYPEGENDRDGRKGYEAIQGGSGDRGRVADRGGKDGASSVQRFV